jgi:signal transduction histidine kinase
VLVALDMTGPQVQITVTDNGPGIAASALAQLGQTASAPPGFGLGLAFARRVITQHPGGVFTIRSVEGSGTSVAIAIAAEGTSPACVREVGVADVRHDARQH